MWAKLRGYPAWPAQVLSVYAGHEAPPQPRPGCVLVHFFGTYDIQWLDNEKKARNRVGGHCDGAMADALSGPQVSPFRDNFEQNAAASKQKARSSTPCKHAQRFLASLTSHSYAQPFLKAVAEAQHFEATGGAAGGELPAGMTGLYQGATTSNFGDLILKPKVRSCMPCLSASL